jgi:hypothetical protein
LAGARGYSQRSLAWGRALVAGVVAFGMLAMLGLLPSSALADTNEQVQAANATHTAVARAQGDLANAIAQGKITRTPTSVPPTLTPQASATATAIMTPEPTETFVALPALPMAALGADPLAGYIRPSATDQSWLELALPQGRWDVRFDTPACEPLEAWSNVWLAPGQDAPLLVARAATEDAAMCGIVESVWHSDVPCASTDSTCDVEADGAYWAALEALATQPPMADVQAADPPAPEAVELPRVSVAARAPQPVPPAAPVRQVEVIVQTVVVFVTAVRADTPTPNPRPERPLAGVLANATEIPTPTTSPPASVATESAATTAASAPVPLPTPRPVLETAVAQPAVVSPVAELTPPPSAEASVPTAWIVITLALIVGLVVCGAIAVVGVRSGLIAYGSDRQPAFGSGADRPDMNPVLIAGVVAVSGIIVLVILIVMAIGLLDR